MIITDESCPGCAAAGKPEQMLHFDIERTAYVCPSGEHEYPELPSESSPDQQEIATLQEATREEVIAPAPSPEPARGVRPEIAEEVAAKPTTKSSLVLPVPDTALFNAVGWQTVGGHTLVTVVLDERAASFCIAEAETQRKKPLDVFADRLQQAVEAGYFS